MYLPFPYGILIQVICYGTELLVSHLSKTRSRPENEKPGNENLNNFRFTFKSPKSELAATRGTSILGEVRNVEIQGATQQLLTGKSHDFLAIFALAHSKINQIA
jgi:hypothetical protein